jgi:hypothetical protein
MDLDPKWVLGAVPVLAGGVAALHRLLVASLRSRIKDLGTENKRLHAEVTERTAQLFACMEGRRVDGREASQLLADMSHKIRG